MGIPRPTLYRYLREYSIPHFRRSGRISIPEDSFEKIRTARDLHREGMGTGSVRRILRESGVEAASSPDTAELTLRLDRLSRELEGLRGEPRVEEVYSAQAALRTVLARQTLLISAVFNLSGMVEDLLRSSGGPRRQVLQEPYEPGLSAWADLGREAAQAPKIESAKETRLVRSKAPSGPAVRLPARSRTPSGGPAQARGGFGSLAQRRRRRSLATLVALAGAVGLLWLVCSGVLHLLAGG